MIDIYDLTDEFGPEKVLHINDATLGLQAIVVIDNTAIGPSIGGVRMASDVTLEECIRLARAMTRKNAAAGLPHGGGKSVIFADPALPTRDKERIIRAFARAIKQLDDYIPGPDMGTNEVCMAWVCDEIGRAAGLPRVIGGIPLDEIGATGFGIAEAAEVAEPFSGVMLNGARIAIQGYGAVGKHAAHFLEGKGARVVAVADSRGTAICSDGFDLKCLDKLKAEGKSVIDYPDAEAADQIAVITTECDILIPAARPDIIDSSNAGAIHARLIIEGANIPATVAAEEELHARGVLIIPDFIANAGGVICASIEYRGGTQTQAMAAISESIRYNTREVLSKVRDHRVSPRIAANRLAESRLRQAMNLRRKF